MEQSRLRLQEFEERQRRIKQEPIEANEVNVLQLLLAFLSACFICYLIAYFSIIFNLNHGFWNASKKPLSRVICYDVLNLIGWLIAHAIDS